MPNHSCDIDKGMGNKWKVKKIKARASDTITWSSAKTEFRIWFPPEWNPLTSGDDQSTAKKLTRSLRGNVNSKEEFEYSIFCFEDNRMAEENSSPVIIIE